MQFLHLGNTLIIDLEGSNYTIDESDLRYLKLLPLIKQDPVDTLAVKDILTLKFSEKIKHAGIKDGQFVINGQTVPEPFSSFLLNLRSEISLFEFYYNLYFTLQKTNAEPELRTWAWVINEKFQMQPFSLKEATVLVRTAAKINNSKYFTAVNEIITEEDIKSFTGSIFTKNLYKPFKAFIFSQNNLNWNMFKHNIKFFTEFKDNEDKFISEIQDFSGLSSGHQYLMNEDNRSELLGLLRSLRIKNLSQMKRFFSGSSEIFANLNQMHLAAREIARYPNLYAQEVFFQDYEKLTFEVYGRVLSEKLLEWKKRIGDPFALAYFKLEQKHPWLTKLNKFSQPEWGDCYFLLPIKGGDLDMWSNTMSHCIRGYKEKQYTSPTMILLSIVTKDRLMVGTLELHANYHTQQLGVTQFVGYANDRIKESNEVFYQAATEELQRAFGNYCKKLTKAESI